MQAKPFIYKYLRHTVFLLSVICLLLIGRNSYSYETSPELAETTFTLDEGDNYQDIAFENTPTSDLEHQLSTIHRRHHTARRFIQKPTGRHLLSTCAGTSLVTSPIYTDKLHFSACPYTLRLRYYILLFLYALF